MEIYGIFRILWRAVAEKCWRDVFWCRHHRTVAVAGLSLAIDFASSHCAEVIDWLSNRQFMGRISLQAIVATVVLMTGQAEIERRKK